MVLLWEWVYGSFHCPVKKSQRSCLLPSGLAFPHFFSNVAMGKLVTSGDSRSIAGAWILAPHKNIEEVWATLLSHSTSWSTQEGQPTPHPPSADVGAICHQCQSFIWAGMSTNLKTLLWCKKKKKNLHIGIYFCHPPTLEKN
uniref:Uncharacterized protein n=1 Tax=Lygus hesperus TaxID=30085 RepID=A0A146KXM3_LYGHE